MSKELHTPEEWKKILDHQADYTRNHRHTLYEKVDVKTKEAILDVGCGTGVITADIGSLTDGRITGIDIDEKKLSYAKPLISDRITFMQADVLKLPFKDNTFDLVVFSVVLVHIRQQQEAVNEMARVVKKGGIVLATLEPDYAGGFHYPESKADPIFEKNFEEIGVEMETGRKLRYLFVKAGLQTEIGIYSDVANFFNEDSEKKAERYLEYFYKTEELLLKDGWTKKQVEEYKQKQLALIKNNLIFSFTPGFYAIGRK